MEIKEFFSVLKRKKQTLVAIFVFFVILTTVFTFVQPLKYSSESRLIVVQKSDAAGIDPFVASRTNEYISSILSQVILSNSFFEEVLDSGYNIEESYFNGNTKKKLKKWKKTVNPNTVNNTGILQVEVFHSDRYQSEQIARGINMVLKTKHSGYHGAGKSIEIKTIDMPITSFLPVKPNIFVNYALCLVLTFVLGFSYVYLFPGREYDLKVWPTRKKEKEEKAVNREKGNSNETVEESSKPLGQDFSSVYRKESVKSPSERTDNSYNNQNLNNINKIVQSGSMDNLFRN